MKDIFEYRDNFIEYAGVQSILIAGNPALIPNPEVSVIIPTFKRPDLLKQSLESVINQDYAGNYEIIIMDNSGDNADEENETSKLIKSYHDDRILLYRNEKNIGMFGNMNRGIELARSNYLTYCHDDDKFYPDALTRLMELAKIHGEKEILSNFSIIDAKGLITRDSKFAPKRKLLILENNDAYEYSKFNQFISSAGFGCGCLFSKQKLLEIGGYDPEYYPSADYAMQATYAFKFGCIYNAKPTFYYRIAENESLNVYDKFAVVDEHFRNCMKKYLKCPNIILNRIIKANKRISEVNFAIMWGKESPTLCKKLKISDRLIMKACRIINAISSYRLASHH